MLSFVRPLAWMTALAVIAVYLVWFLAFRVGRDLPDEIRVTGLGGSAEITWIEGIDAEVKLQRMQDLPRIAGVVHAVSRPWTLFVLRQTALGRLSEWYGEATLGLDRHVKLVGIPQTAKEIFDRLDGSERESYAAFASGVNASLGTDRVTYAVGLSVLGVEAEPWLPWHSLAVERLVAWLSATVVEDSLSMTRLEARVAAERDSLTQRTLRGRRREIARLDSLLEGIPPGGSMAARRDALVALGDSLAPSTTDSLGAMQVTALAMREPVRRFLEDRDRVGDFLALGGLDHSAAWVTGAIPEGVFVRFVWGSASEPPIVALHATAATGTADLVTWLGSPAPMILRDARETTVSVSTSSIVLAVGDPGSTRSWASVEIREVGNDVVERRGDDGRLLVGDPGDSLLIAWSGFVGPEAAVIATPWGPSRTIGESLVRVDGTTAARFTGVEPTRETGVALVGRAAERFELARSLSLVRGDPVRLLDDTRSAWAAGRLVELLGSLAVDSTSAVADSAAADSSGAPASALPDSAQIPPLAEMPDPGAPAFVGTPPDEDAVAYLRNWSGSYESSSIAATLFEPLSAEDTIRAVDLQAILDSLVAAQGTDRRTWRWERDASAPLRLAGGSGSGVAVDFPGRFDPVSIPRRGHPTSPAWGSSPRFVKRPAPAAWEAFVPAADRRSITFRRPTVPFDRFLGRFMTTSESPPLRRLEPGPGPHHTTTVVPPS